MFIIDDQTDNDLLYRKGDNGMFMHPGYDPETVPIIPPPGFRGMNDLFGDSPGQIKIIPQSEYDARIEEQEKRMASLDHVIQRGGSVLRALDQNGQGYCWSYSTGYAVMLIMAMMNRALLRVSPHSVACKLKGFRDEGGWCGYSGKFSSEEGYASEEYWPQQSMSRQYDNAETWADAKKNRTPGIFYDVNRPYYDQRLSDAQINTLLLMNIPVPADFRWWGHSICLYRLVRVERGVYGKKFMNSYSPDWGENGTGVLTGNRAIADNAVALYDMVA